MPKIVGVDESGRLRGESRAAVQSAAKAAFPGIPEALASSQAVTSAKAAYDAEILAVEEAKRGTLIHEEGFEDPAKVFTGYGATVKTGDGRALKGSGHLSLPVHPSPTSDVHAYSLTDFQVVTGKKYSLRVWLRSTGAIGDASLQLRVAKVVDGKTTWWKETTAVALATTATTTQWSEYAVTWAATETTTARLGISLKNLGSELLADGLAIRDITTIPTTFPTLDAARATWLDRVQDARTQWATILPEGVVSAGADSALVTITAAEYQALAVKDPSKLYVVTE